MKPNKTDEESEKFENTYRCASRSTTSCPAYVEENKQSLKLTFHGLHVCSPFIHGATISRLKERMMKLSKTTTLKLEDIFKTILEG